MRPGVGLQQGEAECPQMWGKSLAAAPRLSSAAVHRVHAAIQCCWGKMSSVPGSSEGTEGISSAAQQRWHSHLGLKCCHVHAGSSMSFPCCLPMATPLLMPWDSGCLGDSCYLSKVCLQPAMLLAEQDRLLWSFWCLWNPASVFGEFSLLNARLLIALGKQKPK